MILTCQQLHRSTKSLYRSQRLYSRGFFSRIFGGESDSYDGNPIEDALKISASAGEKDGLDLPKYNQFQPQHLTEACKKIRSEQASALLELEASLRTASSELQEADAKEASDIIQQTLSQWHDGFYAPLTELHNISATFTVISDPSTQGGWTKAHNESFQQDPIEEALEVIDTGALQSTLSQGIERMENEINEPEIPSAANWLSKKLQPHTLPEVQKEEFQANMEALQEVDATILQVDDLATKPEMSQFLSSARQTMDLKHKMANLVGYPSHVDQIMEARMATEEELRQLHVEAAEAFLPIVASIQHDPFDKRALKIAGPTLEGCLGTLTEVISKLFGVEIREETNIDNVVWNRDARAFHLYDKDNTDIHLGSIILDPFRRPGKLQRSFTVPLRHRRQYASPVVGVCLELDQPVWDDGPADMTWDQAEALFHEFAHALQLILARSHLGGILGAHNLPLDASEILPKFFEHCLFEKSCLESVVDLSNNNSDLSADTTKTLLEWRRQRKALQIMQSAYFGALELELFTFDPQGEESLIGMYRRLNTQFVPHDMPAQNDLSPLLQILKENASGTVLGGYRYFYGELIAAGLFRPFVAEEEDGDGLLSDSSRVRGLGRSLRLGFLDSGAAFDTETSLREFDGKALGSINDLVEVYS